MQSPSPRPPSMTHRLSSPNPGRSPRSDRTSEAFAGVRRRHLSINRAQPVDPVLWARHVSALDNRLGGIVDSIKSLLRIQAIILVRQDCARRALETFPGALGTVCCPYYLVDPIRFLDNWPDPHADTPTL